MTETVLWALPLGGAMATLGVCGWRRTMRKRDAERHAAARSQMVQRALTGPLPPGTVEVRRAGEARASAVTPLGLLMMVAIATYGIKELLRTLVILARTGQDWLVGSILVIENDATMREEFDRQVPAVFRDRIVRGYSQTFSGGGSNQHPEEARASLALWALPVERAVRAVADLHRRRNASHGPADVIAFVGFGGQVFPAIVTIDLVHEQFEAATIVGAANLSEHSALRHHWQLTKREFEAHGVHCWLVTDNLCADVVTADNGLALATVAIAKAPLQADQPTRWNNLIRRVAGDTPGAVLSFQVAATEVVAFQVRADDGTPVHRWYVHHQKLVDEVVLGLRRVELGTGVWSLAMPVGAAGRSIFDVVVTSLASPADLTAVRDDVVRGLQLQARYAKTIGTFANGHVPARTRVSQYAWTSRYGTGNYGLIFASVPTPVTDPAAATCPVIVVRFAAITRGHTNAVAAEIAKFPSDRRQQRTHKAQATTTPTNGLVVEESGTPVKARKERTNGRVTTR